MNFWFPLSIIIPQMHHIHSPSICKMDNCQLLATVPLIESPSLKNKIILNYLVVYFVIRLIT